MRRCAFISVIVGAMLAQEPERYDTASLPEPTVEVVKVTPAQLDALHEAQHGAPFKKYQEAQRRRYDAEGGIRGRGLRDVSDVSRWKPADFYAIQQAQADENAANKEWNEAMLAVYRTIAGPHAIPLRQGCVTTSIYIGGVEECKMVRVPYASVEIRGRYAIIERGERYACPEDDE